METRELVREYGLFSAWAISLVATAGSLFFSEVMMFTPCELCWYQRILMYPLVVLLGIAVVRKDYGISLYGMVFAAIGAVVSFCHYLLQKVPSLHKLGESCGIVPCTAEYINWLGFITIPFLALTAFVLIFFINLLVWRSGKGR